MKYSYSYRFRLLGVFLLTIILVFGEALFLGLTSAYRAGIRSEMTASIEKGEFSDQLVSFVVDPSNPRSGMVIDGDEHELEVDGVMYDVVSSESRNGVTTYYCERDSRETSLNEHLQESAKQRSRFHHPNLNGKTLLAKIVPQNHPVIVIPQWSRQLVPLNDILFESHAPRYSPPPPRVA